MPIWLTLARIECQRVLRQSWLWHHRLAYGAIAAALFGYALLSEEFRIRKIPEISRRFFAWWSLFHMFSCYFWVAVLARGAFSGDGERASLDCVKATTVDGYDIVRARFLARMWAFFILICPAFPVVAVGYSMRSIAKEELAVLAIWSVVTASYVGAIAIAFSVSRKTPGAALGSTLLCLACLSIVPGLSPWHQLLWVDPAEGLAKNALVLGVASLLPIAIAWQALRRAGEVIETPYDLVGLKVSSDEHHRAAETIEAASVVGKFFAWAVVFVAAVPSLGGYGFLLFYCLLDPGVMQMLFPLIPATAVFVAFLFLRILASEHFDRKRSLLMELFATPLPTARAIWKQVWTRHLPLQAALVALIAASVFGVAVAGLAGALLIALLWIELLSALWAAAALRLCNDSTVAAFAAGLAYLFGIWLLPFLLAGYVQPTDFAQVAGWTALGAFTLTCFWRPAVVTTVFFVALRHTATAAAFVWFNQSPDSTTAYSPASLLVVRYDFMDRGNFTQFWEGLRAVLAHLLAALACCAAVYIWLTTQIDLLIGRPGLVERLFARWLRRRKSRFGFPFPFR